VKTPSRKQVRMGNGFYDLRNLPRGSGIDRTSFLCITVVYLQE
jgi:hypothetical protein